MGMYLSHSNSNTLNNNIVNSNWEDGIYLDSSSFNIISNNSVISNHGDGIGLEIDILHYWRYLPGSDSGSDSNKITNNTVLENKNIGIRAYYSNNNTISNNNVSQNRYGISIGHSYCNTISGNIVIFNNFWGIRLYYSDENNINNNTAKSNGYSNYHSSQTISGIILEHSSFNTISNNNVTSNNYYGLYLEHSNGNVISSNNASSNNYDGICLKYSDDNILYNNKANSNNRNGIYLDSSNHSVIYNNNANLNTWYGIYLDSSNNNMIYLNNFVNNTYNVYSSTTTNVWNTNEPITYTYNNTTFTNYLGNYWSDYTGIDADGDGVGDSTYTSHGINDKYPLMERFENYILAEPIVIPTPTPTPEPTPTPIPTPTPTPTPMPELTDTKIFFDPVTAFVELNKSKAVPVKITTTANLTGIQFTLTFDKSIIRVEKVETELPSQLFCDIDNNNGRLSCAVTLNESLSGTFNVAELVVNATSKGTSFLIFTKSEVSTDTFDGYAVDNFHGIVVAVKTVGDVNDDGKIDIVDLTKTAWMVIDKIPDEFTADFNRNGRIDVGDLARLAYFILGRINELLKPKFFLIFDNMLEPFSADRCKSL